MKTTRNLPTVLVLAACAAPQTEPREPDPCVEETRAYLAAADVESVSYVRYQEPLSYKAVNNQFIVIDGRGGPHLVETERYCEELTEDLKFYADMMDSKAGHRARGRLRAGVDTIRGCRIEAIYKLPQGGGEPEAFPACQRD